MGERVRRPWEAAPEELGHRLVEIEQEGHAGEPQRQRGKREEVRQAVDLDEGVTAAPMGAGQGPA